MLIDSAPESQIGKRDREGGTAFVITLLAMVVLGIILLSLSVITNTERQIAANELTSNRVFYSSETGLAVAVSRALTIGSTSRTATPASPDPFIMFAADNAPVGQNRGQRTTVTPFFPIREVRCDLCPSNETKDKYKNVNHAVSSTAERLLWPGGAATPPATARVTAVKQTYFQIGLTPWWAPTWEAIRDDGDYTAISQDTKGIHVPSP